MCNQVIDRISSHGGDSFSASDNKCSLVLAHAEVKRLPMDDEGCSVVEHTGSPPHQSSKLGYTLAAGSALCFSLVSLSVHVSTTLYSFPAISCFFYRSIVQLVLSAICKPFLSSTSSSSIRHRIFWLTLQSLFSSLAGLSLFIALSLIRAGDAVALFFIAPVFTFLLAHVVLSESLTKTDIFCLTLSLSGIILMTFSGHSSFEVSEDFDNADFSISKRQLLGVLFSLAAAFLFACSTIIIRFIGQSMSFINYVLAFGAFSACLTGPFGGIRSLDFLINHLHGLAYSALAGVVGFLAQCSFNKGVQHIRAGQALLLANVEVPLTYFSGLIFLNESPAWPTIFGASLIVLSGVLLGTLQL